MNHTIPAPTYCVDDEVTITDDRIGRLRLIVASTEPATFGGPDWLILTDRNGYGRWRRRANEVTRGWGN